LLQLLMQIPVLCRHRQLSYRSPLDIAKRFAERLGDHLGMEILCGRTGESADFGERPACRVLA